MTLAVNHLSPDVECMAKEWPNIDALMGGTAAMRSAGKSLLPQWLKEPDGSYTIRLSSATLFPAYKRTASVMAGKPFAKQLGLSDDTPAQIRAWSEDIDNEGVNLHTFASEMFMEAIGWGFGGILVDAPRAIVPAGRQPTRAEQKKAGVRPYFVRVKHNQILGWRTSKVGGASKLTQLRISECATKDDGDFGEVSVHRVRVLTPGAFKVYEASTVNSSTVWSVVEEGATGLDLIPFVPVYGFRSRYMVGTPPLVDLGYLNVKHWQSQSDQDTILHVARVPILFARCFADEEEIVVGGSVALKASSEKAELKFVEHSGASISAGRESLAALEEQMIQSGAELLVKKPGDRSATESANDAEGNKCDLQRIAEGFEDSLDLALSYMAKFANLDQGGNVALFKDYGAMNLDGASGQLINEMQTRRIITKKTAIKEQQRRGNLSPDIDPETELAAVDEEGPAPGTLEDDDPNNGDE